MGFWSKMKAALGAKTPREDIGLQVSRWSAAPPRRGSRELLQAYRENPWLRTVVSKVADRVAAVEWQVSRKQAYGRTAGQAKQEPNHPLLGLLRDPNDYLTGWQLTRLTQVYLDLVGEAFWVVKRDEKLGVPVSLWPVPPHMVSRLPDMRMDRNQRYYEVNVASGVQRFGVDDVIHFRELDPEDPYGRGVGPGFALGDELDTDESAARFVKNGLWNNMLPAAIAAFDTGTGGGAISPEQAKRFKEELAREHQGADRAGKLLLAPGKVSLARLDTSLVDMDFVALREFVHDFIRMNYGVPPELVGDVTNSNRATADAANDVMAENVVLPRMSFLQMTLQKYLVPAFGNDLCLGFVSPVPDDLELKLKVMTAKPEAFLLNEFREVAGEDIMPELVGVYAAPLPGQKPEDAQGGEEPDDIPEPDVDESGLQ